MHRLHKMYLLLIYLLDNVHFMWYNKNIQINNGKLTLSSKGCFRVKHQGSGNLSQSLIAVTGRVLLAFCDRKAVLKAIISILLIYLNTEGNR